MTRRFVVGFTVALLVGCPEGAPADRDGGVAGSGGSGGEAGASGHGGDGAAGGAGGQGGQLGGGGAAGQGGIGGGRCTPDAVGSGGFGGSDAREYDWQPAEEVVSGFLGPVFSGHDALFGASNSKGQLILLWAEQVAEGWRFSSKTYDETTGWGTTRTIAEGRSSVLWPSVAINESADAAVVWIERGGSQDGVWANQWSAAEGWEEAMLVEPKGALSEQFEPHVTMDARGNVLAVWPRWTRGDAAGIWFARHAAGGDWTEVERLAEDEAFAPVLAGNEAGSAIILYGLDTPSRLAWARHYRAPTGWSPPVAISSGTDSSLYLHSLAMRTDGSALAAWFDADPSNTSVFANRYTPKCGWQEALPVEQLETTARPGYRPLSLDVAPNGHEAVSWLHDTIPPGELHVRVNLARAEDQWGSSDEVSDDDFSQIDDLTDRPHVVADDRGNVLAIWRQLEHLHFASGESGYAALVLSNRYTPATGWGEASPIDPVDDLGSGQRSPVLLSGANGTATAVWMQYDDDGAQSFWASRLE